MAAVSRGVRRVRNQSRPGCAEISEDSAEGLGVKVGMQRSDQIHNMLRLAEMEGIKKKAGFGLRIP